MGEYPPYFYFFFKRFLKGFFLLERAFKEKKRVLFPVKHF